MDAEPARVGHQPVTAGEGVARTPTPDGEAAIEVMVERATLRTDDQVTFVIVNRGRVELTSGPPFQVERWDGRGWQPVPWAWEAARAGGSQTPAAFTDEGWILRPGQTGPAQRWPFGEAGNLEPGRYRVTKSARYEGRRRGTRDLELTAHGGFRVDRY